MDHVERPVYVVFPAALFDGWEVLREPSDQSEHFQTQEEAVAYATARGETDGGATIRLENWYGDVEGTFDVHPAADSTAPFDGVATRSRLGPGPNQVKDSLTSPPAIAVSSRG